MVIDGLQYDFLSNNTWTVSKNLSNCNNEVRIKESIDGYPVVSINDRVFCDNEDLEYIHLPDTIFSIGEYAFTGCLNLKRVKEIRTKDNLNIPEIMIIHRRAFQDCRSLIHVETSKKMTLIGGQNFQRCHKLETVGVHNEIYGDIPKEAFQACTSMDFMVLSAEEMVEIGNCAFNWCSAKDMYFKVDTVQCADEDTLVSLYRRRIFCGKNCNLLDLGFEGTEVIVWEGT